MHSAGRWSLSANSIASTGYDRRNPARAVVEHAAGAAPRIVLQPGHGTHLVWLLVLGFLLGVRAGPRLSRRRAAPRRSHSPPARVPLLASSAGDFRQPRISARYAQAAGLSGSP